MPQLLKLTTVLLLLFIAGAAHGQVIAPVDSLKADSLRLKAERASPAGDNTSKQFDVADLFQAILHPRKKTDSTKRRSPVTVVPNIAANPTIGFQLGIKAVAGKRLGNDPKTLFSVAATSASITTKGIIYFYINHNVFTSGNKWNLQGNLVVAKTVTPDFGQGIGNAYTGTDPAQAILADNARKVYPINSIYYNIREKVYKNISKNLFLGAGLSFEIRRNIKTKDTINNATPLSVYNNKYDFPKNKYSANGLLFNIQYITRDNPNRPYTGIYTDAGIRINQTWLGSTKNAVQLTTDFRKYFRLSAKNPETVLAFWNWGNYLLAGTVPYIELPGTARDGSFRSGRGYTGQYFKSTQYNDTELELRFPILKNKFLSGVVFGNLQTANDFHGTPIFDTFRKGYGAGLRVLFNKATRTNLALDYAFGEFGNKGFFLNLNETF
ncbi:MAG: BamA/TamA family outer membrane protein [Chitinophagaceae bacterium]